MYGNVKFKKTNFSRNLSVQSSLSKTSNVFLIIAYVFSSTKLEKRAEQVLPGSEGGGEGEVGDR
jgi:hypothetical protein